jgi:hypothetical protein
MILEDRDTDWTFDFSLNVGPLSIARGRINLSHAVESIAQHLAGAIDRRQRRRMDAALAELEAIRNAAE